MRNNVFKHSIKNVLTTKYFTLFSLLLVMIVFSNASHAKQYKVEVLVFENNNPTIATENNQYTEPRESKSGSQTWALAPSLLVDESKRIQNSSNYKLVHHFSWGQGALPYQKSPNYSVIEQDIRGWIKVYAEQLLFVNIDIDYLGYRMTEKRRLKLNERHFFDHPKFGLLIQVSRLEKKVEE